MIKQLFYLSILLSITIATKCKEEEEACIDPEKINPEAVCTMQYDPVCGCDGVTYSNECQAINAGVLRWDLNPCK